MNRRQLMKLGVPRDCVQDAIVALEQAVSSGALRGNEAKTRITWVLDDPEAFLSDEHFGAFARALIADRDFARPAEITYRTWGAEEIDESSHAQMRQACALPVAVGAALMADAHVGYGLPIGGVLACHNAVIPYAVGVDIACRMKLSVFELPSDTITGRFDDYRDALQRGTRFGVGAEYKTPFEHCVFDQDWSVTRITRQWKDRAWRQLGTSGSGNHFAEFGLLTLDSADEELGLAAGQYVALLSHSGSRGAGAAVCSTYSTIARGRRPTRYRDAGHLAWLDLDSQEGQEYWAAMNLMGDYAAANHEIIHRRVAQLLGVPIIAGVENHHNFAWKEIHAGREVIVHRKGATPAGPGVLGVIPGSMADPAFVIRGKGNPQSLHSASHGAGRRMSRKQAKQTYRWNAVKQDLAARHPSALGGRGRGAERLQGHPRRHATAR